MNNTLAIRVTALIFLLALATILGAWGFEIYGGLPPCSLCLKQRWAYYAGLPLLALALVTLWRAPSASAGRWLVALGSLCLLAGGVLAAYHAGVEWKFWEGPQTCGGVDMLKGATSVLPDLKAPIVSCDTAAWRLFGLSLAGYNALISFALAGLGLWAAWTRKRNAA